jgi:proline iminopeptidase
MLENGDHIVRVNGVDLNYSVAGEGPLLFVTSPGWGIGSTYLKRGLAPLMDHFRIIYVTTRGSGQSGRPTDASQMGSAQMADDIEQLRQHLGLRSIDLFGHSNGGAIAISYAERYGPHLRKLILTSSQLLGFDTTADIATFLNQAATDPRYREAAPYAGRPFPKNDPDFVEHFTKMIPLYLYDPKSNAAAFIQDMGVISPAWAFHAQAAVDCLPSASQVADLAKIQAQTLILVGRHCWICPIIVSERLHEEIKASKLVVLERTGHFPWIEEPERFFREVTQFLAPQ